MEFNIYLFQTRQEAELYAYRLTRKNKGWWYHNYWTNIDNKMCDKYDATKFASWRQKEWSGEIAAIEILDEYNAQVCLYGYWE